MCIRDRAIAKTEEFYHSIGLATKLSQLGIDDSKFETMAHKVVEEGPVGSFRQLYFEDVVNIYKLAL